MRFLSRVSTTMTSRNIIYEDSDRHEEGLGVQETKFHAEDVGGGMTDEDEWTCKCSKVC
jgi:hypothetical protein